MIQWYVKSFEQLSTMELFKIYQACTQVFVVKQACAYQEVDDKDLIAIHLFAQYLKGLIAYCRIIPFEKEVYIGRVLVDAQLRRKGLARELMRKALHFCEQQWQGKLVYVQAQLHLQVFYQSLGFRVISEVYLEDGIPHLDMVRGAI